MKFGERITYDIDGHVAIMTIHGEGPLNFLTKDYYEDYNNAIVEYREDNSRVLVIKTDKEHFTAGYNIKAGFVQALRENWSNMYTDGDMVTPKPIVSAIKGFCIGDGFGILLASDFVFADKSSKFACPETKLGINAVTMQVKLTQRIGHNGTMAFMVPGDVHDVNWLDKVGLCHTICDGDVNEQAIAFAHRVANENGPMAVRGTKGSVWHTVNSNMDEAIAFALWAKEMVEDSKDAVEGVQAFIEKRKPNFKDE